MHQPGERWIYDTGSDLLGVLIARACNQSFDAFLEDRVFQPLGMADTAFSVQPEKLHRFSVRLDVTQPTQRRSRLPGIGLPFHRFIGKSLSTIAVTKPSPSTEPETSLGGSNSVVGRVLSCCEQRFA
jgi:CubicO group peptidase (beta-lactamase class C family)